MMGIGILGMVLFWAVLIVGIVLFVRWFLGHNVINREESALEILKKRYARGEMNKQEFEERKRDLVG
jgi:putative membrane protein